MKNRTTQENSTAKEPKAHFIKSTPKTKAVINELLTGKAIHHKDWISSHRGEEHRLSETVSRLRHKFGFGDLIQCPRGNHPLKDHYFIAPSDIPACIQIAKEKGLWMGDAA